MDLENQGISEEREVNLKDLFWKILKEWRLLVISMIVFSIVISGYKYCKDVKDIENSSTEGSQESVSNATKIAEQLKSEKEYVDKSDLMKINPYNENIAVLQYYVNTNYKVNLSEEITMDNSDVLVSLYTSFIENGGLINSIQKKISWENEEVMLNELITIEQVGNLFTVTLIASDATKCEELEETIEKAMSEYQIKLVKDIGSHELQLVDNYTSVVIDDTLVEKQKTVEDNITSLETQLGVLEDGMSEEQVQVISGENKTEDVQKKVSVSINRKYVILGVIVGFFAGGIWIALCYLMNGKLKSSEDMQRSYGVRIIGEIREESRNRKVFGKIDKWLDLLIYNDKRSYEEQIKFICTNIHLTSEREQIKKIFVTSAYKLNENEQQMIKRITVELEKTKVRVIYAEDIATNAQALEEMVNIGKVIFIEKKEKSTYDIIEKEIKLCAEQQVQLLGAIVVE